MKKILIILAITFSGWQVVHSQNIAPNFRFIWNEANYLFYDTYDLQQLSFQYSVSDESIIKAAKNVGVIDHVELTNGNGIMYFKENPKPSDIRKFTEKANLSELYVNDTRILSSTLLDPIEITKLSADTKPETLLFNESFNTKGTVDNIKFNIHYFESKINSMYTQAYPHNLYSGYVTTYTEQLADYRLQLLNFNEQK